ncbi:MAG: hypothetical protein AAGI37_03840 [Planctomycetota bacterium]
MTEAMRILTPRSASKYDNAAHAYPDDLPQDPSLQTIFWLREINAGDQVTELWIKDYSTESGKTQNLVGWYDRRRLGTMARDAKQCSPSSSGVYHSLNSVDPKNLGTVGDKPKRCGKRVSSQNVLDRRLLMIDVDPDRPIGQPATDEERKSAYQLLNNLLAEVRTAGWPDPAIIDSGNGFYAIFRIDLPPSPGDKLVSRVLKALASRFNTDAAGVDTTTADLPRLMRLPGTMNRKGHEYPDDGRVHRLCQILDYPPVGLLPVTREQLESVAAWLPQPPVETITVSNTGTSTVAPKVIAAARRYVATMPEAVSKKRGHNQTYAVACKLIIGFDLTVEQAMPIMLEYNTRCLPPWSYNQLTHKLNSANEDTEQERGRLRQQADGPASRYTGWKPLDGPSCIGHVPNFGLAGTDRVLAPGDAFRQISWDEWVNYFCLLTVRQADFQIPETLFRQCWWGGKYPKNWRPALTKLLPHRSLDQRPCHPDTCLLHGLASSHSHYRCSQETYGVLEQFATSTPTAQGVVITDGNGVDPDRKINVDAPNKKQIKAQMLRESRIAPIYWPALLFGQSPKIKWGPDGTRALLGLVRELARTQNENDLEEAGGLVIKGNMVAGAGAEPVCCPYLSPKGRYVTFGGNGKKTRVGRGYMIVGRSNRGWIFRLTGHAMYEKTHSEYWPFMRRVLRHLRRLSYDLDLVVVGYNPKKPNNQWRSLNEMIKITKEPSRRAWLNQCTMRIYAPADWLVRWRYFFSRRLGFRWIPAIPGDIGPVETLPAFSNIISNPTQLNLWMERHELNQTTLAKALTDFHGETCTRHRVRRHSKGDVSNPDFWNALNDYAKENNLP